MNKSSYLFIICLLLQFTLSTPGYAAKKNSVQIYKATLKQAKSGSAKAMFLVARMIENGKGTKKNINEASKWYQRSASQNYAAANARLGKLYLEGIGVKKNPKKAFSLLNLAAIQGIPVAQFNLAIIYELGIGTKKDLQEAIKWYDYAAKGGYYTANIKSINLKKQLGITVTETKNVETTTIAKVNNESENKTLEGIGEIEADIDPIEDLTEPEILNDQELPIDNESLSQNKSPQNSRSKFVEEQALLSNTLDRDEIEPNNIQLNTNKLNKKQKLALIKNEHIKRTIKTLLDGRWFDKNRPVNFLPSPKANCNIINQSDIKCISRQLQRHTDRETVFYKTLSKISKLTSNGSFTIQYQNTVVKVVADKVVTEDGILYESKIKPGLQKKIHQLNCQYKNISNLSCINNSATKFNFKNRAIVEKTSDSILDQE